ncbi:hypothetical protein [Saccharothrix deserti]|uniref:hypothetical protein n=1 Tax=Saccharothrix deserti TaxID=2593674 RepID=UPI00131BEB85|nr:hypothetical protein [Saccharothrix deserti]
MTLLDAIAGRPDDVEALPASPRGQRGHVGTSALAADFLPRGTRDEIPRADGPHAAGIGTGISTIVLKRLKENR